MRALAWVGWVATMLAAGPAAAAIVEVGPGDDVEGAINAAQPGDEIVLAGGTYTLTERFSFDIAGTEAMPIVIRAADGELPHLNRPNADQNIIDIDGAVWVEIRGIEFSGGSAGIRISGADHLTIADCEIHDTADVALRANDSGVTYESLHVVGNHIHHTNGTGEGMYLGCNNDDCRLANGIIELNHVHDTNQASVSQGDGIELKEGSYGTIIRDNVIHDTNYPCILTYSTAGNGSANIIERNMMWNCGDHGIQSAADADIRNNIVLSAVQDGIAMQQHQSGAPSNLRVTHNTVIQATNNAISLRDAVGDVLIANNAVYAESGNAIFVGGGDTAGLVLAGNVGTGGVSGAMGGYVEGDLSVDFEDAHFGGMPPIDVFPDCEGALLGAGDPAHVADHDFNETPREGVADVGAYRHDRMGNPGGEDTGGTGADDTGDPTGGIDPSASGDEGLEEDTADPTADGSGGTGAGSAGAEGGGGGGDGCSCRSAGEGGGTAGLLLLGLVALRRRRGSGSARGGGPAIATRASW